MTSLKAASIDELLQDLLHSLFPLIAEGELPVPVHKGVWLQLFLGLAVWSMRRWGEHRQRHFRTSPPAWSSMSRSCGTHLTRLGFPGHLNH